MKSERKRRVIEELCEEPLDGRRKQVQLKVGIFGCKGSESEQEREK